jgi:hypothetical protein
MNRILLISVLTLLMATVGLSQLKKGSYGIQTGVLGNSTTLGGVYNLQENLRLGVDLGFGSSSPSVGSSSSTFDIGAGIAYYLGTGDNLSTFVGGKIAFGSTSVSGASSSSFGINGQFGAEYWFSPRLSLSGILQLGFSSSGPSGATTSNFGTSTGTALTFYLD